MLSGVSQNTAATHVIEVQGERVSVQEYFKRKYTQSLELLKFFIIFDFLFLKVP